MEQDYDKWKPIIKEILNDPRMQEIKRKNIGYFYKVQDDLLRNVLNLGICDYELLDKYSKNINEMISEFLPKSEGWK